ncbi:MAG: BlaI/MecI/CopY family transcriptional regulator [Acidimicrobiales bacterium]
MGGRGWMTRLGGLERRVMDELWATMGRACTGREVSEHLPSHAYTTILTVLDRLEHKGLVHRQRDERAHRYSAVTTREEYTVSLMREALVLSADRNAALVRFAETASADEATILRHALAGHDRTDPSNIGRDS